MKILASNNFKPVFKAKPMPQDKAARIDDKVHESKTVAILCHKNTDIDSFTSAEALASHWKSEGKDVKIIATKDGKLGNSGMGNVINEDDVDGFTKKADVAVCVDFSSMSKLEPNVQEYLKKYSAKDVIVINHGQETEPISSDGIYSNLDGGDLENNRTSYLDPTAKSCAAIIYRFLKALNVKLSYGQNKALFAGMLDDMRKSAEVSFYNCPKVDFSDNAKKDFNSQEVYKAVEGKLKAKDRAEIIKHVDPVLGLEGEQKEFYESLFDDVEISENGKFAYVVIDKDNQVWKNLGEDGDLTRPVLKEFRARLLQNDARNKCISPELRDRLEEVQVVGVINHDSNKGQYQISLTSKLDYVRKIENYVRNESDFNIRKMGHSDRGGWNIPNDDRDKCKEFFNIFLEAAENIKYDTE